MTKSRKDPRRITGVQRVTKKGVVYYYHRATRTKLPGEYASPEFMLALEKANATSEEVATEGTLAALIRLYKQSEEWRKLAPSTRSNYATNLKAVTAKFGKVPIDLLVAKGFRRDVLRWRDDLGREAPRAANAKVTILCTILNWAERRGEIDGNSLKDVSRTYKANRADIIWEASDIAAFNEKAMPALQKAVLLASETGQRSGDLLKMRWADYDGKAIRIRQGKTGRSVYIPVTEALKTMLDGQQRRGSIILTNSKGRAWTADNFKRSFRAARSRAKLDHLHFHDLRGTTVTRLAEAGCTVPEIAAITGHSISRCQKIIDTYMKRTDDLAEAAIAKLEQHRRIAQQVLELKKQSEENAENGKNPDLPDPDIAADCSQSLQKPL